MDNSTKKALQKLERKERGRKFLLIGVCVAMVAVMILPYLAVLF